MSNEVKADVVHTDVGEFIKTLGGGRTAFQMASELERVVKGVVETAKPGKLTLTVEIAPLKGATNQLAVEGRIRATVPEKSDISVFFPTREGKLSRKNPDQREFDEVEESFKR